VICFICSMVTETERSRGSKLGAAERKRTTQDAAGKLLGAGRIQG
jgi:hypothetical protein